MRILLTGFEPNDEGLNASELVVNSFRDDPPQELSQQISSIECKVMPGNTYTLESAIQEALDRYAPDVCLLTGQSDRNKVTLERLAINVKHIVTPDRAGNTPKNEKVALAGPAAYWGTLPELEDLVSLLEHNNIPAAISNHCGTNLCNQIFYHALHFAAIRKFKALIGFVHVPILPEQVIKHWPQFPFMPIEMTRKALSLIIGSLGGIRLSNPGRVAERTHNDYD